jgi:hypothetical protein
MLIPKSSQESPGRLALWDIASLIDLEMAVSVDDGRKDEELKRRDREFFLSLRRAGNAEILLKSRPWVLWQWLQHRKPELAVDGSTPGEEVAGWLTKIQQFGFCLFLLLGIVWVWGNLNRDMVSVLTFALVTTGIPLVLSSAGFYFLLSHRFPRLRPSPPIFRGMVASVLTACVKKCLRHLGTRLEADRIRTVKATLGALRIRLADRRGIVASKIASATHMLGLGWVIGISVALFFFKSFSDQNYGWMTHASWIQESTVSAIVRWIAVPWRTVAGEGKGYPTAAQIMRSRFFRAEKHLEKDHSANETWSSFLLLTSLAWGVMPRVALFVAGRRDHRRALESELFTQHRFDEPWRRMTRREFVISHPNPKQAPDELICPTEEPSHNNVHQCILLVPAELAAEAFLVLLRAALDRDYGLAVTDTRVFSESPDHRAQLLAEFRKPSSANTIELLFLQEAFMPPTRGFRRFLTLCREHNPNASIRVILIGNSYPESCSASDRSVWSENIISLGDARISLLVPGQPSGE